MGAFIHPLTDWGFKRIFGDKELLMDFLNSLLEGERVITDLQYLNTEQLAEKSDGRKTVYDLYCKTDTGEYIIVEMQNSRQAFFKDRALYYMAQSVVQQSKKGREWQFELTAIYGIYFVNFPIDKNESTEHYCKDIALIDKRTGKVFNNKFRQIYIELPRFMKTESDCNSFIEYWIYNLVNMNNLKEISFKDRKAIFDKLERLASQANLTEEERARLEEDWKNYNDYFNTIDFAKKEGKAEGRAEGEQKKNLENAKKMKDMGLSFDIIMQVTGLPIEEIEKL
ncbi:MAG: PD-(D/E)XK nuclease family transposase [Bacteroidaceae bacterium]|nr:PD-(D/E)XK nuclease family transposase [Bacteroidaceae bacterium]MBR5613071.1 PD-(D/E)XK nuclease family transposase [Bacteroidaceae bacterium]